MLRDGPRVHLRDGRFAKCGIILSVELTDDPDAVTCGHCRKHIDGTRGPQGRSVYLRLEQLDAVIKACASALRLRDSLRKDFRESEEAQVLSDALAKLRKAR